QPASSAIPFQRLIFCDPLCLVWLQRLRKKYSLLSSRAQRGICFFTKARKKPDSSGNVGLRNDKIGVFPRPVQRLTISGCRLFVRWLRETHLTVCATVRIVFLLL